MVDVFISYSRTDLAAVTRLAEAVEAEGYEVWWDADLPPHLSYGDVITAKIGMAKAAIVVWSKDSAASEWVRAEADMARNQKKLVQTSIDNVMPPLPFNQIQYAEIGDWRGEPDHSGWRKVKASLAELVGREPVAAPRPDRPEAVRHHVVAPAPVAPKASQWPLFAGVAVAAVALLGAAWLVLRDDRAAEPAVVAAPASPAEPASPALPPAPQADAVPEPVAAPAEPVAPPPVTPEAAGLTPGIEVLPFSSDRLVTPQEIARLNGPQLWIARNEIFARHGRRFRDPRLQQWFSRFSWYQPAGFEVALSPIEQQNVARLQRAEARFRQ